MVTLPDVFGSATVADHPEPWDLSPVRCVACGLYTERDEVTPTRRGPVCAHCTEHGEAE